MICSRQAANLRDTYEWPFVKPVVFFIVWYIHIRKVFTSKSACCLSFMFLGTALEYVFNYNQKLKLVLLVAFVTRSVYSLLGEASEASGKG